MDADQRATRFRAVADAVYEELQRYLRRRCAPADVDDVLNDSLLAIWRRIDDVPVGSELPWCYGVARRCLANQRRGEERRRRLIRRVRTTAPRADLVDWTSTADRDLEAAMSRLSELDREVVRLWAWEQLEPREIAEVLGTTPNAASVRLGRARARLRADIDRQDRAPAGHEGPEDHPELER